MKVGLCSSGVHVRNLTKVIPMGQRKEAKNRRANLEVQFDHECMTDSRLGMQR